MTTHAGEMSNVAQPNPQWVPTNGQVLYVLDPTQPQRGKGTTTLIAKGNRHDYIRQTGRWGRRRGLGPLGWIIIMPRGAGWSVSTATDDSEANLTTPPTVQNPPLGVVA